MYSTSQGLQGKLRALRRHENHCDSSQNVGFIKKISAEKKVGVAWGSGRKMWGLEGLPG